MLGHHYLYAGGNSVKMLGHHYLYAGGNSVKMLGHHYLYAGGNSVIIMYTPKSKTNNTTNYERGSIAVLLF